MDSPMAQEYSCYTWGWE